MSDDLRPEVRELLSRMADAGLPNLRELPPVKARETFDELKVLPEAERETVDSVEERSIPAPSDGIPVPSSADGDDAEVPIRIYTPEGEGPFPTCVYFHGGGWVIGTLETHEPLCRAVAHDAECVVVSVGYRLAPEHPWPAAVEDAYAAVQWVEDHPDEVGGDGRLAVMGDSAGGNLAAVVSLLARDFDGPDIDHQHLVYPATSYAGDWDSYEQNGEGYYLEVGDMWYFVDHYLRHGLDGYNRYAFPMEAGDFSKLPSATVVTCEFDPLRDEGKAYAELLDGAGVDVTYREYEGLIHGAATMLGDRGLDAAREMLRDFSADLRRAFESTTRRARDGRAR